MPAQGTYLAADLGGTNFRVCIVNLHGQSSYSVKQSKTAVPLALMTATSWKPLFTFLAQRIQEFLKDHDHAFASVVKKSPQAFRGLAFTFSFTYEQTSLSAGKLLRWDKGFHIPSAVGLDPCGMLQEELNALNVPVLVSALANDTVGTYMAHQYVTRGKAIVGAVFGTGTNGAYLEKMSNISKIQGQNYEGADDRMVINTEWGAFDDATHQLLVTTFDEQLDRASFNPGEQRYEKLVSGMYLGEIFRRALVAARDRASPENISRLQEDSPLFHEWEIPTSLLSTLANYSASSHALTKRALCRALEVDNLTDEEVRGMTVLANSIGLRAARLAGVAISAVIIKTGALQAVSRTGPLKSKAVSVLFERRRPHTLLARLLRVAEICWRRISKGFAYFPWHFCGHGQVKQIWSPAANEDSLDVGLEGTLAASYPGFTEAVRSTFCDVEGIGKKGNRRIRMAMVVNGSSVGTALIAKAAEQQANVGKLQ